MNATDANRHAPYANAGDIEAPRPRRDWLIVACCACIAAVVLLIGCHSDADVMCAEDACEVGR